MLIASFLFLWLLALLFPESPLGRLFHRTLVALPARVLTPGRLPIALVIAGLVGLLLGVMSSEGVLVLAQGLPEGLGWIVTFDIVSYVDVAIVAVSAAAAVRLRGFRLAARRLVTFVKGVRSSGRAGRQSRRPRRPAPAADADDSCSPAIALA